MSAARIVVVDDNTADVSLLRLALDQQGDDYELEVLESADRALRFVHEYVEGLQAPQPCVILLDLHLPRYDGITILDAIRRVPVLARIHVIVLSGVATPQEQAQIALMGAIYRQKPFNLNGYVDLGSEILAICADALVPAT